jgi:hypothetical protein
MFTFHKIIHNDIVFVTPYSVSNYKTIITERNKRVGIDYDDLHCSSITDMLFNADGEPFIMLTDIYE